MAKKVQLLTADLKQEVLHPETTSDMVQHGGSTLDVELGKKFDKTGGTITGDVIINQGLSVGGKIETKGRVITEELFYALNAAGLGAIVAKIATHGGVDLGDSNVVTAICSSGTPKYYDGNLRYDIYNEKDHPISLNNVANTLVQRNADGDIVNGNVGKVISYNLMSPQTNLLLGGNAVNNTFTGDVVFRTNMRPYNNGSQNIGGTNYRFGQCWVTTGAFNTSDERCKTNIEVFDIQDCFDMVKNTNVKSYTLLTDDKTKMSDKELKVASLENEEQGAYRQLGIIAQDIVDYKCADYILVQDNPEDLYAINPYNFTSALMGALKVEISKREELEDLVLELKKEVDTLKAKVA